MKRMILGLVAVGCAPSVDEIDTRQDEIYYSAPDPGDPATVSIWGSGSARCTGTLIGQRLVLTAAHCVDDPHELYNLHVRFGEVAASPTLTRPVVDVAKHPSYGRTGLVHDIALLLLDAPVTTVTPVRLNRRDIRDFLGTSVRIVGYGQTETLTSGTKREETATIASTSAVDGFSVGLSATPSVFGGGDSGGTTYLATDGIEVISGVHSASNGTTFSRDMDVHLYIAAFIQPYILANDPTALDYDCSNIVPNEGVCEGSTLHWCNIATGLPDAVECSPGQECAFIGTSWRGVPTYGCADVPPICTTLGKNCGLVDDGAGNLVDCGTCADGDVCNEGVCCTWSCTCDYINTCGTGIDCPIRCPGWDEPS